MLDFKIGDKVICINDIGCSDVSCYYPVEGKIYIISFIPEIITNDPHIFLKGMASAWRAVRFRKILSRYLDDEWQC